MSDRDTRNFARQAAHADDALLGDEDCADEDQRAMLLAASAPDLFAEF